jgi:Alpha/beta hydrolase
MDLAHFVRTDQPLKGAAGMAEALRAEEAKVSPDTSTAVIAWSGYVTPVGLGADAATARLAEAAAPRLESLLDGLKITSHPETAPSLYCHSYGSVVCGIAAPKIDAPQGVTDMVVFGSPGMDVQNAAALGDGVRVWAAARNPGDWIGNVPYLEIGGLGHGADPTSPDFGSHVIASTGANGHNGYLADGTTSLRNFADIALGRYADVVCSNNNGACVSGL